MLLKGHTEMTTGFEAELGPVTNVCMQLNYCPLKRQRELPSSPVVRTRHFHYQKAWVQSLVWDLRSHKPLQHCWKLKKKKKSKKAEIICWRDGTKDARRAGFGPRALFADPKSEIFSNSKFLNNRHRDAQL